jgi:hypothetical protein
MMDSPKKAGRARKLKAGCTLTRVNGTKAFLSVTLAVAGTGFGTTGSGTTGFVSTGFLSAHAYKMNISSMLPNFSSMHISNPEPNFSSPVFLDSRIKDYTKQLRQIVDHASAYLATSANEVQNKLGRLSESNLKYFADSGVSVSQKVYQHWKQIEQQENAELAKLLECDGLQKSKGMGISNGIGGMGMSMMGYKSGSGLDLQKLLLAEKAEMEKLETKLRETELYEPAGMLMSQDQKNTFDWHVKEIQGEFEKVREELGTSRNYRVFLAQTSAASFRESLGVIREKARKLLADQNQQNGNNSIDEDWGKHSYVVLGESKWKSMKIGYLLLLIKQFQKTLEDDEGLELERRKLMMGMLILVSL